MKAYALTVILAILTANSANALDCKATNYADGVKGTNLKMTKESETSYMTDGKDYAIAIDASNADTVTVSIVDKVALVQSTSTGKFDGENNFSVQLLRNLGQDVNPFINIECKK